MGSAYTPGLKVSARTNIEKLRRLPLKGKVIVEVGDLVNPRDVIARAELPGIMQTVKLAEMLGILPSEVEGILKVTKGERIEKGLTLAQTKGLFGFFKSEFKSPVEGTLEMISEKTGHLGVRQAATPIEKDAYIKGRIVKVIPEEGVVVACEGALIQGIFGVGGERLGDIKVVVAGPNDPLTEDVINESHAGKIIVGGSNVSLGALRRAAEVGVNGIVVGGIVDRDLIQFLREALGDPTFDIGVAITGQEPISFTLVVTEGFGTIRMAVRTFELMKSLEGHTGSINGATQIRAGVIRPEVIVPLEETGMKASDEIEGGMLDIGTAIRIIREPYFGLLATVSELPSELTTVESETYVRILRAKLEDGREVTVPRANVEIIETK